MWYIVCVVIYSHYKINKGKTCFIIIDTYNVRYWIIKYATKTPKFSKYDHLSGMIINLLCNLATNNLAYITSGINVQ